MSKNEPPKLDQPSSEVTGALSPEKERQLNAYEMELAENIQLGIKIGHVQANQIAITVAGQLNLQLMTDLKKNKRYKKIPLPDQNGQITFAKNWEMFCPLAWRISARRSDELMKEYRLLGEELHGLIHASGLTQRNMTAFSRLSADERTPIEQKIYEHRDEPEAIAEFVTFALNKASAKTEKTEAERDEALADAAAKQDCLDDSAKEIQKLEIAEARRQNLSTNEAMDEAEQLLTTTMLRSKIQINELREAATRLEDLCEKRRGDSEATKRFIEKQVMEVFDHLVDEIKCAFVRGMLWNPARADSIENRINTEQGGGTNDKSNGIDNSTDLTKTESEAAINSAKNVTQLHTKSSPAETEQ